MKKVLIISRSFPPENISAVYRPFKFVKYLPHFGWKPYVVTTLKNAGMLDHSLLDEIQSDVQIYEVFSFDPLNLKSKFKLSKKNSKHNSVQIFLNALFKIYSAIYYRTIIIDDYDGWIPNGLIKGVQIIKEKKIDLIYAHGQPPCSFFIGFLLKKITGKPLVIDYDDSWTTSFYEKNRFGLKKIIRRGIEARLLKTADNVISVKKSTIDELQKAFNGVRQNKFNLIYRNKSGKICKIRHYIHRHNIG
jgi:hypothetical protein